MGRPVDAGALAFGGALQAGPLAPEVVLDELVAAADPGLVATAGPRYFGFVIGGSLDAALAADVVAAGWDPCAFNAVLSPAAIADLVGRCCAHARRFAGGLEALGATIGNEVVLNQVSSASATTRPPTR